MIILMEKTVRVKHCQKCKKINLGDNKFTGHLPFDVFLTNLGLYFVETSLLCIMFDKGGGHTTLAIFEFLERMWQVN